MITSSVVRFARTASAQSSLQSASACIAASSLTQHILPFRSHKEQQQQHHQRRNSSSKASIPPNGSSRGRSSTAPSAGTSSSSSGRSVRGRKPKAPVVESGFAHLPSVPSTQHLLPEDINVSSFFSLHRPISVTAAAAFPAATSPASFAQMFNPDNFLLKHQPIEVIKTLGSVVEDLEGASSQDRYIEEAGNMIHGDSTGSSIRAVGPRDLSATKVEQYQPFRLPPAPEVQSGWMSSKGSKRASRKRSWQTTIKLTEETRPNGQRIYTAKSVGRLIENPAEEDTEADTDIHAPPPSSSARQTFLERMRTRQEKWDAISVKRQRKLKMKKHKYKKLMKKTRNERRRLGKL